MNVLIAGDRIGGLTTTLSLHAVGIEAEVFEQAPEVGEVGVGIDMLPRFVKELAAVSLLLALDRVGIRTDRARTPATNLGHAVLALMRPVCSAVSAARSPIRSR